MINNRHKIKETIIQLLSNLANPKEIQQYLKRFAEAGQSHFAVVKVSGSILKNDMDNLCSSLTFLERIGLFPIVVHGAGVQLNEKLARAGIETSFIDGQRVTTPEVLELASKTFMQQNLALSRKLQIKGVKTASMVQGVFKASKSSNADLGFVGENIKVDLTEIQTAIDSGIIPIISSMATTDTGQCLNISADLATSHLAIALNPYKIIFLADAEGLFFENGNFISSINLVTDFKNLMDHEEISEGTKLKIKQVNDILAKLPETASVSITKPQNLAKELFTHRGSGTLIRKGELIILHEGNDTLDRRRLTHLIQQSFNRTLDADYFENNELFRSYVTFCYRAASIMLMVNGIPYLDKFVVADDAKGDGLGKALWRKMNDENPNFFWRSRIDNPINSFYFSKCTGCYKTEKWIVFWTGDIEMDQVDQCIDYALAKKSTLS